jgi:site-specific DNA-methyltransferase (adenine-specific)
MTHTLHLGDCRAVMATLDDNSIDSIVCDPPYELGFMGKAWDNSGIAYDVTVWQQCLRVLKPGGHLIAFGGSRTYHRLAVAIEDVGFEIRDQIQWIYGSGFPKSLDVSKAMDKQAKVLKAESKGFTVAGFSHNLKIRDTSQTKNYVPPPPVTDLAKQWQGWQTALKPAHEPAVLARKPLCGTVADNVMTWGVGGLNIDGTRIETEDDISVKSSRPQIRGFVGINNGVMIPANPPSPLGRWPANVILDEDAATALDKQSGDNVSRFFYTVKAPISEKEAGLYYELHTIPGRANHHPTVKPIALMRYLVRLVTPKGGKVLDPFMGSGSTGCASMLEGFEFVGIDITPEYIAIAQKRIDHYAVTSPLEGF